MWGNRNEANTGRKIIVDNYGPEVAVGGGAFSGKDPSKVDRSAAYMARRIAVDYLEAHAETNEVFVKLAYAIGHPEALMAVAIADGVLHEVVGYDQTHPKVYVTFSGSRLLAIARPLLGATLVGALLGSKILIYLINIV